MPVNARKLIRKMRGGAQSHLIEADDGKFYIVKFQNNPQHRRILVNEWLASRFLEYLQIAVPPTTIVNLSEQFLNENPDVHIQLGTKRSPVAAGWHFGSCFPGDPATVAVYDFVPDALLLKVENLDEFLGILAFDKWTANADARQSIFLRARLRDFARSSAEHPLRTGFVALMMDHGYVFNGPHWDYPDSPLQGLYFRPMVYQKVRGWDDFQPWLDRIIHFPEDVVDDAYRSLPPEWVADDGDLLEAMLENLMKRRKRVPDLIKGCSEGRVRPFPNWK
jgi:hypothetical protein